MSQLNDFYRVCVKLYAPEPWSIDKDAAAFVPVFHDWIRHDRLDVVLIDVADYAHAPDSPGIMLVSYEASFALDRSDGAFGLLVQRRTPTGRDGAESIAITIRHALRVAGMLEREPSLAGRISFDRRVIRIESNDRLRVPNSEAGFERLAPAVREALASLGLGEVEVERVPNDPRDRLVVSVAVPTAELQRLLAA